MYFCFLNYRSELEEEEIQMLDDMRKCTKSVEKSTIETTAYLRALGESKGLNVAKFREEIKREMENEKTNNAGKLFQMFQHAHLSISSKVIN